LKASLPLEAISRRQEGTESYSWKSWTATHQVSSTACKKPTHAPCQYTSSSQD